jgi:hypothetical protein
LVFEVGYKPFTNVMSLSDDVASVPLVMLYPFQIFLACCWEREVDLAPRWQVKATLSRLGADALDGAFCLLAGDAFTSTADDAMNAPAIHHNIDAVAHIAICELLDHYSVFVEFL